MTIFRDITVIKLLGIDEISILVCQIEKLELWKESLLMGQIANQMALELFFKIKERIKEKKKQKQDNKNNGSKK